MTRVTLAALAVGGATLVVPAVPGLPGTAGPALAAKAPGPIDRAVGRLQDAQRKDGGFGRMPGARRSDPATSVWAALALASVGVHPDDQPRKGTTALDYLQAHADELRATEDLARLVLVLRAAQEGESDAARAAVATLASRQLSDGGFPDAASGPARLGPTAYAVLALSGGTTPAETAAVTSGGAWLVGAADPDGGWGVSARARARPDTTGLGLQALRAAQPDELAVVGNAQAYLVRAPASNGAYGGADPRKATVAATALVLQGLRASGYDPRLFDAEGKDRSPVAFVTRSQHLDGGYGDTVATARVLPGLNGVALPLKATARGSRRANASAPAASTSKNAAASSGGGGAAANQQATTSGTGSSSSGSSSASTAGAGTGSSSGATPGTGATTGTAPGTGSAGATATPTTSTTPSATTTAATPSTTTTTTTPATPGVPGENVSGAVVGTGPATDESAPGVAAGGGGGGDDDAPALALAGLALALLGAGTQLERRRPRPSGL